MTGNELLTRISTADWTTYFFSPIQQGSFTAWSTWKLYIDS